MAWVTPSNVAAFDTLSASRWNQDVVANTQALYTPPMCRAERNTTQSITTATSTFVSFDNQIFDTDTIFAPTSDTFTIQTAGVYAISAGVRFTEVNAGSIRAAHIMRNPSNAGDASARIASSSQVPSATGQLLSLSAIHTFAVNDTVKLVVFHDRGASIDIGEATSDNTFLSVAWVGKV